MSNDESAGAEAVSRSVGERHIAVAESLTSGNLAAALGAAPGASDWFRGGIVAYSKDVKHRLLRVPEGPVVSAAAAEAMGRAACELMEADLAVAVTGSGGPDGQDGMPPGTVWLALVDAGHAITEQRRFAGEPEEVLHQTVLRALDLLLSRLRTGGR